ncbi:MAG: SDR family oxidoreductase, partial [Bacteroidota bacterium]
MKILEPKVAIVTGASRGLGRALAHRFSREGASVVICSRSETDIRSVQQEIQGEGGECVAVAADISRPTEVEDLLAAVFNRFERVDVLVNNASLLGPREAVLKYPYRDWLDVLDVNLTGPFLVTKAVLRSMVEQRSGSIINVSSGVGSVGKPRWGAYLVSKFGVEGF